MYGRLPDLLDRVFISFSRRLSTSLGRCTPAKRSIRLHPGLSEGPPELPLEVICHEISSRGRVRALWPGSKDLTALSGPTSCGGRGFEPRVRLKVLDPRVFAKSARRARRRVFYEHYCPVCQQSRVAKRPVRRWRCRACAESGLPGELEIRSLAEKPSDGRGVKAALHQEILCQNLSVVSGKITSGVKESAPLTIGKG